VKPYGMPAHSKKFWFGARHRADDPGSRALVAVRFEVHEIDAGHDYYTIESAGD